MAGLFSVNAMLLACTPVLKQGPARQESPWLAYLGTARHDAGAQETLNPDPRPLWHVAMGRGVRGSPALFVNGRRIDGVPTLAALTQYVEAELMARHVGRLEQHSS